MCFEEVTCMEAAKPIIKWKLVLSHGFILEVMKLRSINAGCANPLC